MVEVEEIEARAGGLPHALSIDRDLVTDRSADRHASAPELELRHHFCEGRSAQLIDDQAVGAGLGRVSHILAYYHAVRTGLPHERLVGPRRGRIDRLKADALGLFRIDYDCLQNERIESSLVYRQGALRSTLTGPAP